LMVPVETEPLEFKEAKQQFDTTKLLRYCVALSNEGGGHLVLGVTNKPPRQVVGTKAFPSEQAINNIKARIVDKLRLRVDICEVNHANGRVLIFIIPGRPIGQAIHFNGTYLMRAGESLLPMTPDMLKQIFAESEQNWFSQFARADASSDDVIALLDTQTYFELLGLPYPTSRNAVLERLESEDFISPSASGWMITNLAAILLAKKLDAFSPALAHKAPRVVIYVDKNKLHTREDKTSIRGYAVGFEALVDFVYSSAPQNRFVEQAMREEVKMFPKHFGNVLNWPPPTPQRYL